MLPSIPALVFIVCLVYVFPFVLAFFLHQKLVGPNFDNQTLLERSTHEHRAKQSLKDPDTLINNHMIYKYAKCINIFIGYVLLPVFSG